MTYNFDNMFFEDAIQFLDKEGVMYILYYSEYFDIIVTGSDEYYFASDDGEYLKWKPTTPRP